MAQVGQAQRSRTQVYRARVDEAFAAVKRKAKDHDHYHIDQAFRGV